MSDTSIVEQGVKNPLELISTTPYTENPREQGSPEFNMRVNEAKKAGTIQEITQGRSSELTDNHNIVFHSQWHIPCFDILVLLGKKAQIHHVNPAEFRPNTGSTINQEQFNELQKTRGAEVVVIDRPRGSYAYPEEEDLENLGMKVTKLPVDSRRWRTYYDPKAGEIWIDQRDKLTLLKYKLL